MIHCTHAFSRRALLGSATAGLAVTLSRPLWAAAPDSGHHATTTLSPEQALNRLKEGNQAYLAGRTIEPDSGGKRRHEVAQGQSPMAVVITCSDSRVAPEILFRQGLGELFVIRNAGNTVDTVAMGSIEYAVAELGVPLVVVLGHERCGAVGAAVAIVEKGASFPGSIGRMVEPIIPAVLDAKRGGASDLLDASVRSNVRRTVARLRTASEPFVLAPITAGKLRIVGARYDLDDGKVDFFDEA
jgi:carbonic anhydrase